MSDITILPNPFKMLDLEREKKMKLMDDKCNSCNNEKKEGFNNLKKDKPIIEGMGQDMEGWLFVGVLSGGAIIAFLFILKVLKVDDIQKIKLNNKSNIVVLALFIVFAFISLSLHTNDFESAFDNNITNKMDSINDKLRQPYIWIPILVGLIMFLLRFVPGTDDVPALIGYFENTVGHFCFLGFSLFNGGLNKWIRSDNFETLINNGDDKVTINFNPLMSIFNLNNYDDIIEKMRIENSNPVNHNTSDFFVTLKHIDETRTKEDFTNYIKNEVKMKRAFGEVTLLILTTLISTGILQSVYH